MRYANESILWNIERLIFLSLYTEWHIPCTVKANINLFSDKKNKNCLGSEEMDRMKLLSLSLKRNSSTEPRMNLWTALERGENIENLLSFKKKKKNE